MANQVDAKIIKPLAKELFEYEPAELRGRTLLVKVNPQTGRFWFALKD